MDKTGAAIRREWKVTLPWQGGKRRVVVVAKTLSVDETGPNRIVTMHVVDPEWKSGTPGSLGGGFSPTKDTAPGDVYRYPSEGQASPKAGSSMAPSGGQVKGDASFSAAPKAHPEAYLLEKIKGTKARLAKAEVKAKEGKEHISKAAVRIQEDPRLAGLETETDAGTPRPLAEDADEVVKAKQDSIETEGCGIDAPNGG